MISELTRVRNTMRTIRNQIQNDRALLANLPRTFTVETVRQVCGYKNENNARTRVYELIAAGLVHIHCRSIYPRKKDRAFVVYYKADV